MLLPEKLDLILTVWILKLVAFGDRKIYLIVSLDLSKPCLSKHEKGIFFVSQSPENLPKSTVAWQESPHPTFKYIGAEVTELITTSM